MKTVLIILLFYNVIFSYEIEIQKRLENDKDYLSLKIGLEEYLKENSFENLFLVFAGPYPASPTSSFGHIFILLEPNEERPFLLWNTIDFSATSTNVGSFEFFLKGIFGGLEGEYRVVPFCEKFREYTYLESRSLWLFPINLKEKEKDKFLLSVYKLKGKSFPYKFSNKNCASQIDSLLRSTLTDTLNPEKTFVLPHTVLSNWEDRINDPIYIESMDKIINESFDRISFDITISEDEISKLGNKEAAILLNILEWKYAHSSEHLSKEDTERLMKLRIRVSLSTNSTISNFRNYKKEFYIHPSMFLGSGIRLSNNNNPEYLIKYRFGLHEFYENDNVYPEYDFLSLLKIELGLRKNKVNINELLLFDQLSLQPISPLSNYLSWRISCGMERRFEYFKTPLVSGLFTGFGYTIPILENTFNLSLLMNLSPAYLEYYGFSFLYGPEIISILRISNGIKLMNIVKSSFNTTYNLKSIFIYESNLGIELSELNNMIIKFFYSGNGLWYSLNFNYYIN